jgi:hypothetical protein
MLWLSIIGGMDACAFSSVVTGYDANPMNIPAIIPTAIPIETNKTVFDSTVYRVNATPLSSQKLIRSRSLLVPAGFIILALSQILWIYWGFTDLNDVLVLANALYVTGLAPLAAALLLILRRRPTFAEVH